MGANNYILVQFDTLLVSLTSLRKWRHHFCFEKTFNISICNRTKTSAAKVISIDRSQRKSNLPASCCKSYHLPFWPINSVVIEGNARVCNIQFKNVKKYILFKLGLIPDAVRNLIPYFFDDTFQLLRSRSWSGRKSIKPVYPVWQAGMLRPTTINWRLDLSVDWLLVPIRKWWKFLDSGHGK